MWRRRRCMARCGSRSTFRFTLASSLWITPRQAWALPFCVLGCPSCPVRLRSRLRFPAHPLPAGHRGHALFRGGGTAPHGDWRARGGGRLPAGAGQGLSLCPRPCPMEAKAARGGCGCPGMQLQPASAHAAAFRPFLLCRRGWILWAARTRRRRGSRAAAATRRAPLQADIG